MYYVENELHFDTTSLKARPLKLTRFLFCAESLPFPARQKNMENWR